MSEDRRFRFFGTLQHCFGARFLCFLWLTYFGLKGFVFTLLDLVELPYFQKVGVSSTEYQLADLVARIPWSMKGFVGVLSDCVPIGRYHKRGYLLLSSAVGIVGLSALAVVHPARAGIWPAASLFFSAHAFVSTFDLLCEGKYSEMMRKGGGGPEVLTLVYTCVQLGSLVASFIVGLFVDASGPRPLLFPCLPLAVLAAWRTAMGDLPEEKARSWKSLMGKARSEPGLFALAMAVAAGSLATAVGTALLGRMGRAVVSLLIAAILVLGAFRTLPRAIAEANLYMFIISVAYLDLTGPLAYFYTGGPKCVPNGPHFSYSYYLAVSNFVGSVGAALGAVMFQYMQHWRFREAFCVTTLIQVVASVFDVLIVSRLNLAIGIPDKLLYLFGDAACQCMAVQMALMPMKLLTARLCPRGAEATVFAILSGFQNFGLAVSSIVGVQLTESFGVDFSSHGPCNFEGFGTVIVIGHCLLPLACLPLTWLLVPSARIDDRQAFAGTQPTSFASPAPSAAGTSPHSSPRADPDFEDFDRPDPKQHHSLSAEGYHLMHEHSDPDGLRLDVKASKK